MKESVIRYLKIENSNGIGENVGAEQIGENEYKLLENPVLSCKINYGTIVKALPNEKGELILIGILKASDFKTRKFLWSSNVADSDFVKRIGDPLIAVGGSWEVVMGGISFIHIPRYSDFDLEGFFKENNFNPTEITEEE